MDYGLRYSRASTKLAQYPLISVHALYMPLLMCMYGIFYQLLLALLDMFFEPGKLFTLYEHNRINCSKGLGIYLYIALLLPLFEECKCNYRACTCVVHITDEMAECKSLSRKWSMK